MSSDEYQLVADNEEDEDNDGEVFKKTGQTNLFLIVSDEFLGRSSNVLWLRVIWRWDNSKP